MQKVRKLLLLKIADFANGAADMVDKEVEVSGLVDHICKHGGKKMHLVAGDESEASLHIVSDEAFSEELEGQYVKVKGVVVEEQITMETIAKWEEEDAAKAAEEANAEEVEGESTEGETEEVVADETADIKEEAVVEENRKKNVKKVKRKMKSVKVKKKKANAKMKIIMVKVNMLN
jgi:hypothetical protein